MAVVGACVGGSAHLVSDALDTGPAAEDEGVVVREHVDGVDALGLELGVLIGVWRQVVGVARRLDRVGSAGRSVRDVSETYSEGSGDGEDDDLLALEGVSGQLGGCVGCRSDFLRRTRQAQREDSRAPQAEWDSSSGE